MTDPNIESIIRNSRNLTRILDNLPDGIIAHDLKRRIFFFNQAAEAITGYHREEVLGKDCHEIFGAPFCGEKCSFCGEAPAFKDRSTYTLNIINRDGDSRCVELRLTLMYDEVGEAFGVLAAVKDITDILNLKMRAGELTRFSNIVGQDRAMLQIYQQIRDVATFDYPVHISGETGTGKELVAEAIHNESPRAGAPFVPINCGALPEGLIESELFGHVRGAFSGAIRDKKGRFEMAEGGTVFLDEVAELSRPMQVKLLRFLQEGTFEKVGGEKTVSVNVRVVSATNKDLRREVQAGSFRDDLFYRLNVVPIHLPPLRERKNDIPLLVDLFLSQARERNGRKNMGITGETLSVLMDYHWPGNVRELQNAVQFAIVKSRSSHITSCDLPPEIWKCQNLAPRKGPVRKLDPKAVSEALKTAGGNRAKAARILGVGRATLYRFFSEFKEINFD